MLAIPYSRFYARVSDYTSDAKFAVRTFPRRFTSADLIARVVLEKKWNATTSSQIGQRQLGRAQIGHIRSRKSRRGVSRATKCKHHFYTLKNTSTFTHYEYMF
jgi:hypothetical protein